MALTTYSTGTVSVSAGGTVTVAGGIWNATNVTSADLISVDGGAALLLSDVSGLDSGQIAGWTGGEVSGKTYVVYQCSSLRFEDVQIAQDLQKQVAALNTEGFYIFVPSSATEPDPSLGDNGQYARQPSTKKEWYKEGGLWVFDGTYTGVDPAGPWEAVTLYRRGSVAEVGGSSYMALTTNTNSEPPSADWMLLVAKGGTGATGATGKGYGGTSTTPLTIGVGTTEYFQTQAGLAYIPSTRIRMVNTPGGWMDGYILEYDINTGVMKAQIDLVSGGGSVGNNWQLSAAGTRGSPGLGDMSSVNYASEYAGHEAEVRANIGAAAQPIFSFEGDSLTNVASTGIWPLKAAAISGFFARGDHHQFAASGETASTMVGQYASQAGSIAISAGQDAYFFLWAGTNDITAGDSASTIYGNLKTLWAAARTSGYKVVSFTIMPRGDINSTQNGVRLTLNALILSDPSLYDFIVRPDIIFSNPADTVNFNADTLHLTAIGNAVIARHVIAAVLGVQTVPAAPFDAMAHSNLIINGACEVSQELGTTAKTGITGTTVYPIDGITIANSGSSVLSAQQVADAPPGLTNSLKVTVTTAQASLGASDYAVIRIPIEGYRTSRLSFGTVNARPVTVGFWTKIHRTGWYSGSIRNGAGGRSYPFAFLQNVSDAWEFKTVVIPGDVAGTWVGNTNGAGLILFVALACGTSLAGTANAWAASTYVAVTSTTNGVAATSDVFQITGAFILPGAHDLFNSNQSAALLRTFDQEIVLCRRYWHSTYNYGASPGALVTGGALSCLLAAATTTSTIAPWQFSEMRDVPTITLYSPNTGTSGKAYNLNSAADVTASAGAIGMKNAHISWSGASAAVGNAILVHAVANARL